MFRDAKRNLASHRIDWLLVQISFSRLSLNQKLSIKEARKPTPDIFIQQNLTAEKKDLCWYIQPFSLRQNSVALRVRCC